MNLRVMSFNLRVNSWSDLQNRWSKRVPRIVEMFHSLQPDIVGTQEGLQDMLQSLLQHLPNFAYVGDSRADHPNDEHCAIFYRADKFVVAEKGQFWLSTTPQQIGSRSWFSAYPRICTWAAFQFRNRSNVGANADTSSLLVYNTHLDHASPTARIRGAALISSELQRRQVQYQSPAILLGDFNARPGSQVVQFLGGQAEFDGMGSELTWAGEACNQRPGRSYHGFRGGETGYPIDHLFVSSDVQVNTVSLDRNRYGGKFPSDHYPLFADLTLDRQND